MNESPQQTTPAGQGGPAPARRFRSPRLAALLAFLAGVLVYANSLPNGFTFDDRAIVEANEKIRGLDRIPEIWSSPYWPREDYIQGYRPLTLTTYSLNYAVHGLSPLGYHLVNVLLHGLVSALVVLLAFRLGVPAAGAALGGLVFAVHPIHTEVVAGVVGRAELLAALAFIAGFLLWLRYRERGRGRDLAGLVAVFVLGNLSKEHVVTLPFVLVAAELAMGRFRDASANRRLARAFLACAVAGVLVFLLRDWATGSLISGELRTHPKVPGRLYGEPVAVRALTFLNILWRIVELGLFPLVLSPEYGFNEIPLARVFGWPVTAGAAIALALAALTVRAWNSPRRFAMAAWAMVTYFPLSNLLVPMPSLLAERTLYIPSVGVAVLIGDWLAGAGFWRKEGRRRLGLILVAAILALWGARTVARNADWRDSISLWSSAYRNAPESLLARTNLGSALVAAGRTEEAIPHLLFSIGERPDDPRRRLNLGVALLKLGRIPEAEAQARVVVKLDPGSLNGWLLLGTILEQSGQLTEAARAFEQALRIDPRQPAALAHLRALRAGGSR